MRRMLRCKHQQQIVPVQTRADMDIAQKSLGLKQDLFENRKCIHIKLSKEVHTELRTLCIHKGITMQDVFEEYGNLLCAGDVKAMAIVDRMILRRLNIPRRNSRTRGPAATELNDKEKESIYDLINDETLEEET